MCFANRADRLCANFSKRGFVVRSRLKPDLVWGAAADSKERKSSDAAGVTALRPVFLDDRRRCRRAGSASVASEQFSFITRSDHTRHARRLVRSIDDTGPFLGMADPMSDMHRRKFLKLTGSSAGAASIALPLAARAQHAAKPPTVGFLYPGPQAVTGSVS